MATEYDAKDLTVLEGLSAVRKRPGMYIGSTDSSGLMHCLFEIIDNCVDEALAGFCKNITVTLHPDGSFEVCDDGRGIPVDIEKSTKLPGVIVVMTKLHAGSKFGNGAYNKVGGLHGVGASVVNALSTKLIVDVARNSKVYRAEFSKGKAKSKELQIIGKSEKKQTGTKIRFWLDPEIFTNDAHLLVDELIQRMREVSFLVPKLKIDLADKRGGDEPVSQSFYSELGIADFVKSIAIGEAINPVWLIQGKGDYLENVQVLDDDANMKAQEVSRSVDIDIGMQWTDGYDSDVKSFVNIIPTAFGGSHIQGFEAAIVKAFRKVIGDNARKFKLGKDDKIEKDDIFAGLYAVVSVSLLEPQFEGQTKEALGTSQIKPLVADLVYEKMVGFLTTGKRDFKPFNSQILEKVVGEMKTRITNRQQKELLRNKNKIEGSKLPSKLVQCNSNEVEKTELFIVEGDSALGTAKLARNSEFQALLPIRGKILNVQKASLGAMLDNFECSSIIQVIGAGSGRSFDINSIRYGKVIIMTDADTDGSHIRILLLTLFYKYLKGLVLNGNVFAAVPPLHRIEVKGKDAHYIYTFSEAELKTKLAELDKSKTPYNPDIQRYKGLGEMDADQLAETTMDPELRILKQITPVDAEAAEAIFELLMGDEVAPRKEFIVESSKNIDFALIDV